MVEFISIVVTIVLFCYFLYYKNKKDRAEEEMDSIVNNAPSKSGEEEHLPLNNKNMDEKPKINTRDLCVEVLRKLNCEVQFDDEDESIMFFTYQGEHFRIDTWKDCLMICIWDTWWGAVDLEDLDEVSRVRKAINIININSSLTMVYSIDQEHQRFVVHTKRQCLMIPEIPNIENYLASMLTGFFEVQRAFKEEMDKLKLEENAAHVVK